MRKVPSYGTLYGTGYGFEHGGCPRVVVGASDDVWFG